jgi:N-acetylglucosaminyldiphosphoundecaprenol N-acetyl-beta-D-mannosaminyltransferase
MQRGEKLPILGVGVNAIDYDGAVKRIIEAAELGKPFSVTALAVHGVMTGLQDHTHRYRLNRLNLVVPDGQPVRWALNLLYRAGLKDRVYGPNLMLRVCEAATRECVPIFLYGSRHEVMSRLETNLRRKFPGIRIVGTATSRFRMANDEENAEVIASIRETGARIVFVGLGCPRQEVFAYENAEELSCAVIAVGAAFDFHAGTQPQAPRWMQDRGLEWLFRLMCEPRRLWRRYIILNPLFCWNLARQWLSPEVFRPEDDLKPSRRQNYV